MSSVSGFTEMSAAALFDRRRNRCAAFLFDSLLVNHTGSFSAAVGDAGRQAAHRLFGAKKLKTAAMLSGHVSACNERVLNLCQTLISTIPAPTFEDACRIVTYYSRRWLIERLHYVLKSGLNAEGVRFDDADSLSNALALYYIVAWQLLRITYLARIDPELPAAISFEKNEIELLSQTGGKQIETFQDEYRRFLTANGVKYDERYMWD